MQMYNVTLVAGKATPLVPQDPFIQRNASFQTLVIGSSTATFTVGDPTVTATNGISIATGSPALVIPTALLTQNLNGWCAFCATSITVTVLLVE